VSVAIRRIAVTGGPGAGKTSVWRAAADAYAARIVAVPEVATSLLTHVFPQPRNEAERHALQRAIFAVQRNLEALHEGRLSAGQVLLCDRGTPDGAGYWPAGPEAFFAAVGAQWEAELARYDAVLFLETAAAGGLSIAGGNATRQEDQAAAIALDRNIRNVWSRHPRFQHVAHERDFAVKLARGQQALATLLDPG
jgi:predicted ATPase